MPWELPITIDGDEYPVSFENEPTEQDVQEAVRHLESLRATPQSLAGAMGTQLSKSYGETLFSQPMQGISGLMEVLPVGQEVSEYAGGVAQDWQQQIEQDNPINPEQAERFPVKAAGAVGQGLGMLTQIATMGGLGLPSAGVRAATLGTAGLAGAGQGQQEADRLNITDPLSRAAMILGTGGIEAGTEMLGGAGTKGFTQALLGEARDFTTSLGARFLKTTRSEAVEEMIAEPSQTQLARALAEEDPANPGFTREGEPLPPKLLSAEMAGQTLEAGALGAVGGAVFGGVEALSARQSLREGMQLRARIQEALSQEQDEGLKQQLYAQDQSLSQKLAQGGISPQLQSMLLQTEAETLSEDVPINPDVAITAAVIEEEPTVKQPTLYATESGFVSPDADVASVEQSISASETARAAMEGRPIEPTIEPTIETKAEIQPEPVLEPATAEIADSGITGSEAAVEQPSDLPAIEETVTAEQQFAKINAEREDLAQRRATLQQIPRDRWEEPEVQFNEQLRSREQANTQAVEALRSQRPDLFPAAVSAPTLEERFPTPPPSMPQSRASVAAGAPLRMTRKQTMPDSPAGAADILDWLVDNKIYVPPKDQRGGEIDFLAQDDRISRYFRQFITTRDSASDTADVIADRAVAEGLLPEGSTANELGAAIEQAIKERKSTRAQIKREGARMKEAERQTTAFYRDTADGPMRIDPADLVKGDVLTVEETPLRVIEVESDEDGYVTSATLQDGKKYGVQTISGDYVFLVDEFRPSPRRPAGEVGEFLPAGTEPEEAFQPRTPQEAPLALESQSPEQITAEREKAARKATMAQKQAAPLKGTMRAEDTTPDMLDTTAGGLFAQPERQTAPTEAQQEEAWLASPEFQQAEEMAAAGDLEAAEALEASFREKQALARQTPENAPERTGTAIPEVPAAQKTPAKPAGRTVAPPAAPEGLDPHWANLGRSQGYTEGDLRTELKETPEYERTQIQQALGAKDNSPQTLAKALKALQPRTGGTGSTYKTERQAAARRDAIDEQLDREEGIVRSRRRSMRSGRVLYSGVTKEAASTAQGALLNLLPTASGAWIGTSKEVKDAPGLRQSFIQSARLRDSSLSLEDADERFNQFADSLPDSRMEGFTVGGRQYVLIDGVGVTEEDRSPERAVRRVMIHEDAHEAVEAAIESDPALQAEWDGIKSEISAEDLDSLAASRYPWMKGWRTDPETFNDLAHEWIAEQMEILEKSGEPPQGLLKRIMDFFRKILARAMGEPEADVTDQRVIDFIEAGRAARAREHRMTNPVRPSQQNLYPDGFGVPEMPEGSAKLITHESPYPGMTSEKIAAYAWPRFFSAWNSHRADPDGPLTSQEKTQLEAAWRAELADENAMEIAADNAFSEERMSRASWDVYDSGPFSTPAEDSGRNLRMSMQPSYSSQSEERESDYKEATAAMPESGREYVQFLGSLTRTPKVAQAVRPMVDFARSLMGSYQGDEIEVNAENTERVKDLAAQAFQKGKPGSQFAEDISEQFRQSGFSNNGQHQGSVMAGVLQMEILDYAVRLAGEGDRSMALALMPYANDVAASDHASISNFGRGLQMRSMAGQQKGFWTILNSLAKGERELAEKNPIYKELREALFSDEVKAETAAAVEKDMDSAEAQKAFTEDTTPENLLDAYLGRALGIMDQAERDITIKLFTDMAELELLLKKQEDMQTPKDIKASMQAARDLNDPVAIQQRIDELKSSISKGLKALDKFKTSEATKETRKNELSKTPKAKKAMSADADAKRMLDRLENKEKRTKKETAPWKKTYTEQIQNPKSEEDFTAEMLKHGVSPSVSRKLFDAAETASAEISKKAKEKARQAEKGPAQTFSAWVGGAEQDGIEDFVDLVANNITPTGFNETGFRRALANKFDKVDPDLIDATTERVKAKLDEQDAEEKDAPKPPDYDARAKKLVTNAISKKSGAEQAKLKDPMTEAIKARMKGDIDAAGLKGRLLSLGIESETVFAVGKKVEEDLADKAQEDAKRKSKALAEKLAREAAMPTKTADQLIDELDAQQTEWLAKGKPKNPIRELAAKARKAPDQTKGPTTFPTWEEFTKQFIALGVNPTRAAVLVSRLRAENAKDRANRVIRKRESASNSKAFVNSVMRDIFGATLEEQADPAWRRQTMVNAFMRNGMNEPEAQKAADWLEYRFSTHLKTAQEKAAQKAAKDLKMKKPTLEKLVKAIRSRAVDPLNTDPVTKALAEEAGFAGITPAQFTQLAKLDGQMRGPYQSQRAKAAARMLDIALAAKPPKGKMEILTQAWISSALSSISTISLSALHAGFIPARRLVTDFAGIAMDVTTGKTKPADAAQLMVNTLSNLQEAARNMYATARFAGVNDAYTQHIVEFINQMHSMQADLQRAVQTLKDPNSTGAKKGLAAIKIAFTSTDIVRRILSTADETWGAMLQDFILRNEAMRTLVQKGNLSPTAAAMLFTKASNEGRNAAEKHLNETGNLVEAQLIARDATQNALLQAVRESVGDKAAEDVGTTANLESPMELGNRRAEDAPLWDIANTGLEWVKQLAIATRRKNELVGRMITGFVTVPANILNRSASFTPLGLARTLYKMKGNPEKTAKFYEETMKTEGQQRMRLIEGITGTLLITALLALTGGDDDEGLVITGSGPEDRGLREAWMKKGNQPNRIEWKDKNGNVLYSIPYARGGFDHLNLPFTLVGTMDDMRLKGIKPKPANVEWGTQYMHTAFKGLFDQAKFFGLKNVASMPTQNLTDKSLASQAAYLAAPVLPWSGLTKSLGRMWTGPTDQSSVRSAVLAQLPFTNFYATPALNALGDQRGAAPTDARWEKSAMSGNPFLILAENKGPDADLYSMMIERGVAPNVPLRSNIERKNGFIEDAKWEQYLKTRGALIKQGIRKNLRALKLLPHKDAQNLMERISADSTRAAKAKLQLE